MIKLKQILYPVMTLWLMLKSTQILASSPHFVTQGPWVIVIDYN